MAPPPLLLLLHTNHDHYHSSNALFSPFLLVTLFLFVVGTRAEVAEWNGTGTYEKSAFRSNGICLVNGHPFHAAAAVVPFSADKCADPLYGVFKACLQKNFYGDEEEAVEPRPEFADSALYLLSGCLQCPFGVAQATVRLLNQLPLHWMVPFKCGEEEIVVSSVSVQLHLSGRRGSEGVANFALGGILTGRECGLVMSDREMVFDALVLEIRHNCILPSANGNRPMLTLLVKMPPLDVGKLREQLGSFHEWRDLSVDLSLSVPGWHERWAQFGQIKQPPKNNNQQQQPSLKHQQQQQIIWSGGGDNAEFGRRRPGKVDSSSHLTAFNPIMPDRDSNEHQQPAFPSIIQAEVREGDGVQKSGTTNAKDGGIITPGMQQQQHSNANNVDGGDGTSPDSMTHHPTLLSSLFGVIGILLGMLASLVLFCFCCKYACDWCCSGGG